MKKRIEKNLSINNWRKKPGKRNNFKMKRMGALSWALLLWSVAWCVNNEEQGISENDCAVLWLNVELYAKNSQIDSTDNLVKACRYRHSSLLQKVNDGETIPEEEIQEFLAEYYESVYNQLFEMLWEKKTDIILKSYMTLVSTKEIEISRFLQDRGVIDALEKGDVQFFQNMVEWIVFEDIQDAKRDAQHAKTMWELGLLKSLGYR